MLEEHVSIENLACGVADVGDEQLAIIVGGVAATGGRCTAPADDGGRLN